ADLGRLLEREDPGAQRSLLGLRVLLSFMLAGMAALLLERRAGVPPATILPPVAALLAAPATLFESRLTQRESLREIAILVGAGLATLLALVFLAPGHWGLPPAVADALFVPVAFLALWLRRYGPLGLGAGVIVFISVVFGLPAQPSFASLPHILLA